MAYKPPMIKGGSGPSGVAKVQFKPGKVGVTFEDNSQYPNIIVMKRDDCPENLVEGKRLFVTLNSNKDGMLNWRPADGMFQAVLDSFVAQEGKAPVPRTHTQYDYKYFTVLLEIIAPDKAKGCKVPYTLRYNFQPTEDENGRKVTGFYKLNSKYTPVLMDFCDVFGVWEDGAIPASDNILPELAKRIAKQGRVASIVLKDGWINTIFATEETVTKSSDDSSSSTTEDEAPSWD